MKKMYIKPEMMATIAQNEELICLSLLDGAADSSDVLVGERDIIFDDSEDIELW